MARPKKAESIRRTSNVMVRFSSIEYELVAGYAKDAGYPISTFVRKQALSEKVTVNYNIHYLGQYLSTKSIYGEFLKAPNKKIFRQSHSDELAQYEEALQILKQHSPDGKFPTIGNRPI